MEKDLATRLPVYGVEGDCILSRRGDYTLAYKVTKPEIFTLSAAQYESLHQAFVKAIRVLPPFSILHLQDWYTQETYQADFSGEEKSWLGKSSERFFHERPWLDHQAYLFLTKQAGRQSLGNSAASSLLRSHLIPEEAMNEQAVAEFIGSCGQFVRILEDSGFLKLERMGKDELWSTKGTAGLIERYCTLEIGENPLLKDIVFEDDMQIGDCHLQMFTLSDPDSLPGSCGPQSDYAVYSTERDPFPIGYASGLGPLLPCNHICNVYVFVGDGASTLKKMEARRLRLQSLAAYSRENAISQEAVDAFLNEATAERRQPVKAHFNVLTWTNNNEELPGIKNKVSSAMSRLEGSPRMETAGMAQIWWAGIPGNEGDLPVNDCFDTFPEQAACFIQMETNYRSSISPFGIRLGDRVTGKPIHVDIDSEAKASGLISNFNTVIISNSGGGKSFFTNHLVRSYYEQGAHIVIIDIGHSYEIQCQLHQGVYFTYEDNNPICFNPFILEEGDTMDIEKKESLKNLLLALWKKSDESHNRAEYVALSNALQLYFEKTAADKNIFPCFDTFYEFLRDDFTAVLREDQVKEKDFDMSNFIYVLRPYFKGGEFDYLLNARKNLDLLQKRFIVFELDNIKDHPILFPVVTLIILELVVSKMRKLEGVFKVIPIEEAWKQIAKQGMAESLRYFYKTFRKFNGKPIVVTQEIDDIISSEVVKHSIINNSDVKILLDQSKFQNKFGPIQELLSITDKQKAEILSLNKGHEPGRLYKDLWIGLGTSYSRVYRLEVSEEEYYIYTSDQKEKMVVKEYIKKYGDVRKGIRMLIEDLHAQSNSNKH